MKAINYNLLLDILSDINNDSKVTERTLAEKYDSTERTIRRYIGVLKEEGIIKLSGKGRKRKWQIKT